MMRMNATTLVLALLLIIGGSAAEKSSTKIDVLEDELFWSRELQETMSVTVPPLPPLPPPTPPSTPPPGTLPPSTPPPPLPPPETRCALEASITCEVGEGIECSNFQAPADRCLQDSTYTFTFMNNGTVELTITEATSKITGVDPVDLLPLIAPTTLEPGGSTKVVQTQRVDYCLTTPINATVTAKADPGGCETENTVEFRPSRRRALRGN